MLPTSNYSLHVVLLIKTQLTISLVNHRSKVLTALIRLVRIVEALILQVSVRLAALAGSELGREPVLLVLDLVMVVGHHVWVFVQVHGLLDNITCEYVFDLVAEEADEAAFAVIFPNTTLRNTMILLPRLISAILLRIIIISDRNLSRLLILVVIYTLLFVVLLAGVAVAEHGSTKTSTIELLLCTIIVLVLILRLIPLLAILLLTISEHGRILVVGRLREPELRAQHIRSDA